MFLGVTGDVRIDDPPMEPIGPRPTSGLPVFAPSAGSMTRTMTRRQYPFGVTVQFAFHRVVSKGIADRYPNLRIAVLEAGCSWVPALVERIEEYSGPSRRAGGS